MAEELQLLIQHIIIQNSRKVTQFSQTPEETYSNKLQKSMLANFYHCETL